tara:strand:- start:2461 stop:2610 length:150 start_codon:yes stop_codon:yes gene_type:complete
MGRTFKDSKDTNPNRRPSTKRKRSKKPKKGGGRKRYNEEEDYFERFDRR